MSKSNPDAARRESGRARCRRWADSLWRDGVLQTKDAAVLADALVAIANGEKASIALSINGRPGGTIPSLPCDLPRTAPASDHDTWSALAISLALEDPKFSRALCGVLAGEIRARCFLPAPAVRFVAYGLWGTSAGVPPERAFCLLGSRGRPTDTQRNTAIAAIAEVMSGGKMKGAKFYAFIAEAAEALKLTVTKGQSKTLTGRQTSLIHARVRSRLGNPR